MYLRSIFVFIRGTIHATRSTYVTMKKVKSCQSLSSHTMSTFTACENSKPTNSASLVQAEREIKVCILAASFCLPVANLLAANILICMYVLCHPGILSSFARPVTQVWQIRAKDQNSHL